MPPFIGIPETKISHLLILTSRAKIKLTQFLNKLSFFYKLFERFTHQLHLYLHKNPAARIQKGGY